MKKIILLFFVVIVAGFCSGNQTAIAEGDERIINFSSNVVLSQDSTATISEIIEYDFGNNERHGIFRDIPIYYESTSDQGYKLELQVLSVLRDSKTEQFRLESVDAGLSRIKIGNPDTTINGRHTYTIAYTLGPVAILADDDTQIVRIDAPGAGWDVPVEIVQISLSSVMSPKTTYCYEGSIGSIVQSCVKNNESTYTNSQVLSAGQNITYEAVFDANTFSNVALLTDKPKTNNWPGVIIFLAIFILATSFGLKRLFAIVRYKSRRAKETVYPRYEPPKDMSPAEIGLLLDNSITGAELSATLIHFAVNGYMKITLTKEKKWWRKAEYEFVRSNKTTSKLKGFESQILTAIFNGKEVVSTSNLRLSTLLTAAVALFKKNVIKSLQQIGFYKPVNIFRYDLHSRMSDEGYSKWAEIEGFRDFLSVTQKDRLAFTDAPEKKPEQFSALLPYAVALGVEKQWVKQFSDITVDISDWYQSGNGVNNAFLVSNLGSLTGDINNIARSMTSSSSGSSGSGGGFSGGGFSGGGGGSW